MSMICIGVTTCLNDDERNSIRYGLSKIAQSHNQNICFGVSWPEPVLHTLPSSSFVFSVEDNVSNSNCELLFLPEGWCYNGKTNNISVIERMMFIQEIAESILRAGFPIEFYIGTSGELPEDYEIKTVDCHHLASYLAKHIEIMHTTTSFHIIANLAPE